MKKRKAVLLTAILLLFWTMTACGGNSMMNAQSDSASLEASEAYDSNSAANAFTSSPSSSSAGRDEYGSNNGYTYQAPDSEADTPTESTPAPQKLIRTATLEMETMGFDDSAAALTDLTEQLDGYFANVSIGGRGSNRWASYAIRIPVRNFQTFLNQVSEICHETRRNVSQEDVSEQYYDTAGRLRTQQIKLERLQALLQQADDMADIITVESAISETEHSIEDLSGALRHYDNLVDYATIELSLSEVYRFSNVEELPDSFASRLGGAFTDGLRDFGEWLEDLSVVIAYIWPWLLLLALVIVALLRLNHRRRQKWKLRYDPESLSGVAPFPAAQITNASDGLHSPPESEHSADPADSE